MCIGIPMQVKTVEPGFAYCHGRGENRRLSTLLVGDCAPGDWLLTFLDDARERIDALRAAEIDGVLDMLQAVLSGTSDDIIAPDFALPSSMSEADIAVFTHHSHCFKAPL